MTDRAHRLSLTRQAELLGISRGNLYYAPRPTCDGDLRLMRRIDELHMDYPFAGSPMMKGAPTSCNRIGCASSSARATPPSPAS